jgi:lipopolysaccharide transport system ATP-binding protein
MPDPLAIRFHKVSKIYRLHGSQSDQLIDVLGLKRFGFRTRTPAREFAALSDISLEVPRGHRIGIVGRNGAGKTTLLKLICGNFAATQGEVEVNGTVQALMNIGLGFHPEYTGRENVEASLQYNGLERDEYREAMNGIIDFCELGDFLDQPFKTYSLGMQARLMFAAATAIRPDILIVDEVLGAGDAYFVAKSKSRVEKLVNSGCTMLLVSHSMQQVLELCDEALWLDQGRIRLQGPAFEVVKAYEAYLHGPIGQLSMASGDTRPKSSLPPVKRTVDVPDATSSESEPTAAGLPALSREDLIDRTAAFALQEPVFLPHAAVPSLPVPADGSSFHFVAPGGISRWAGSLPEELEFSGFTIIDASGETNVLRSLQPAKLVISVKAIRTGKYSCRYSVNISNHMGQTVTSVKSPRDDFELEAGAIRRIEIIFNPLQIGPGEYTVGMVVLQYDAIELLNNAGRYDLLSRSFQFKVENPSSWAALQGQFFHSAEWQFHSRSFE